jgi:hypothetical protein
VYVLTFRKKGGGISIAWELVRRHKDKYVVSTVMVNQHGGKCESEIRTIQAMISPFEIIYQHDELRMLAQCVHQRTCSVHLLQDWARYIR